MGTEGAAGRPGQRRMRRLARIGSPSERTVMRAFRWLTTFSIAVANLIGTAIVFVLLTWVIPPDDDEPAALVNLILAVGYVAVAIPFGAAWAMRRLRLGREWVRQQRPPTAAEQRNVLRAPLQVFAIVGILWLVAAVLFGVVNLSYSFALSRRVFVTVVLAGLATAQIGYLLTEWLLRPVAAKALAELPLEDPALPGVTARTLFTWSLGSGIPMLGLAILGLAVLLGEDLTRNELAIAVLALTATGLFVGFISTFIAARVTADPVISVRHAVSEVTRGDYDVEVPVYDGSELGMLQSGFNQMVEGCASANGSGICSARMSARTSPVRRWNARRGWVARSARLRFCSWT